MEMMSFNDCCVNKFNKDPEKFQFGEPGTVEKGDSSFMKTTVLRFSCCREEGQYDAVGRMCVVSTSVLSPQAPWIVFHHNATFPAGWAFTVKNQS